jgi:hypothetical protein
MNVFDDEAEASPTGRGEDLEEGVPAQPIRAQRPLVLDRGRVPADEETTRFVDRTKPVPAAPASRPAPRSVRPHALHAPHGQGVPRLELDEPTVYRPTAPRSAAPASRRSAPPPPRRSAPPPAPADDPQAVMSWPAPTAATRHDLAPPSRRPPPRTRRIRGQARG